MPAVPVLASPADMETVRTDVESILADFLDRKAKAAVAQRMPSEATEVLREFLLSGGKRLRPVLCVTGWHAAGGHGGIAPVLRVAAALEMFHAFCLIHDDVMDHSDTRRGRPAVHKALAALYRGGRTPAAADDVGAAAAVLVGDLALVWSDELLNGHDENGHDKGLSQVRRSRVLPLIDLMRTEVMYGQYLDLTATGRPTDDVERALAIIRHKTAKYTVERPLHIGAALGGADQQLLRRLSEFALPLGEAFQLRDDLLGVFGSEKETGKPALDDLRAGKHTVLAALALRACDIDQARLLRNLYGNPGLDEDGAASLRTVLQATGAPRRVESMIRERHDQALTHLQDTPLPGQVREWLRKMADQAVWRNA
ncbi:polyprenyl synthetase family protein [Streptomyces sp. NPDC056244]|uniref:polyprenyl synthetase family protein n=1 Tax=Streptomyces sp. NPDC056244 TaxID=3345762 RepID=UPI0035E0445C